MKNYGFWLPGGCSSPPPGEALPTELGGGCEYSLFEFNQAAGFNPDTGRTDAASDPRLMAVGNVTTARGAVAQRDAGKGKPGKGKPKPKR